MPAFPTLDTPQKNEVAGIALSALGGFLNLKLDGAPIRRPNSRTEAGTKLICPDEHETPARVEQRFVCADGHAHPRSEMGRARELDDGTLVPIVNDDARVEAVTGGLPRGQLELAAHTVDEIEAWTRPDGMALRLRLPKKHSQADEILYAALVNLVTDSGFALTGPMVTNNVRYLWWLKVWHRQLYLEARIETANLAPPDEIPAPADTSKVTEVAAMAAEFLATTVEPFNPDVYRHDAATAIDTLAAALRDNPDAVVVPVPVVTQSVDQLLGALEDMVGKRRAEKAAAKKTAPKKAVVKTKAG